MVWEFLARFFGFQLAVAAIVGFCFLGVRHPIVFLILVLLGASTLFAWLTLGD